MLAKGNPSHKESREVGCSQGKLDSGATPSLEIQPHFHKFECLTLSFEPKEKALKKLNFSKSPISYQSLNGANLGSRGPREEVKKRKIIQI